MPTTRASALRRAVLIAAGAVGIGAGAKATGSRRPIPTARPLCSTGDVTPTALPARGERHTVVAELLEHPGGAPVGELYGAGFTVHGPSARAATGVDTLELHTFRLPGGTIVGTGTGNAGDGEFAVVGGTGRWLGARGSYVARALTPGDGLTTEVRFTLTP